MRTMAKIAKAAAKTAAQKTDKDLFSDLGASPRRIAGKATRAAKPTSGAEARYTARDIEVLEGLEPVRRRGRAVAGGRRARGSLRAAARRLGGGGEWCASAMRR